MAYQHHSQRIHTAQALRAMADPDIPAKVKPLLALCQRLSLNGKRAVFATAQWLADKIGRSVSVYYEHRAILVQLGLIAVEERRASYARSAPSLIRVACVKRIASEFWKEAARRLREARDKRRAARNASKCAPPDNRRQKGTIQDCSSKESRSGSLFRLPGFPKEARSQAADRIEQLRLDFIERSGISRAQFDAIPDR